MAIERKTLTKGIGAGLAVYLLIAAVVGMYWSSTPAPFDVEQVAMDRLGVDREQLATGAVVTTSLIEVMDALIQKPGGYISNDRFPPGLWLDNISNWEFGVLVQVRDLSGALRDNLSRSQSQSTEDRDLAIVEPQFNFSSDSWILPASESEYKKGLVALNRYLVRLSDQAQGDAQFYARADNLSRWLATIEVRLGSLSQRLSASVGQRRLNTDLAGDPDAAQSTGTATELEVKTPWLEIDDVFYEARGTAWALSHLLKAAQIDFADVLEKKNAVVSLEQIVRELEASQEALYSPMVLNGSGFGVLANHSLVMASYISRANSAIINLRELLSQG
ncbi:MAG: DUF2333 family protein [Pseudomonadales bacterium]|nr:DUF2333 family protein [Pseudomonadales bacterium]